MLWSYVFFILLAFGESRHAANKSDIFVLLPETKPYQTAVTACREAGMTLIDDQSYRRELRRFLRQNEINVVWLKIKRENLRLWTWITGKKVDPTSIFDGDNVQAKCGGVSLQDRNLRSMTCYDRRNGFVCDVPGMQCPERHFTQGCITYAKRVSIIACKAENWFEARAYCKNIGGDLATVETQGKMDAIFNYIISGKFSDICSWLFVGIRKEDWIINNDITDNKTLPSAIHWGKDEPRSAGGECVQMNLLQDYSWKTAVCSDQVSVVCQKLFPAPAANGQSTCPVCKDDERSKTAVIIALGVLCALSLLAILVTVVLLVLRKRRRERSKANEDIIPLLENTSERISLKPHGDTVPVTIVMFSKGIETGARGSTNINIPAGGASDERASNAARTISSEFFKVIQQSEDNTFSKENARRALRIVNIRASDASDELGSSQTENFLTYLVENKEWIDIIYLPGISGPISHENLSKLRQLRNSCVIICYSKLESTEIPSSEGLSFGVYKTNKTEIRSGIIDILLKEKGERVTDVNTNLAVAKVAGMIAALLHVAKQKGKEIPVYDAMKTTSMMRKYLINFVRASQQDDVPGYGILRFDDKTRKDFTEKLHQGYNYILDDAKRTQVERPGIDSMNISVTGKSLEEILKSTKVSKGTNIKIAFAASPVSYSKKEIEGISIESKQTFTSTQVGTLGDKFLPYICGLLKHAKQSEVTLKEPKVRIFSVPIRLNDKESASDWILYHDALMKIKDLQPDIIYISSDSRSSPRGFGIKRIIMELKRQSVLITGAKGFEGPVAPLAFPAESVMTVSREGGPQGSLVDFISNTNQKQYEIQDVHDDLMEEAWVAAADTVCAAVAVLLKAEEMDIEENILKNLRKTTVMRNVLIQMCNHYPKYEVEDGYGILQPWTVLGNNAYFKNLVTLYAGENTPRNYWSGKVVE